MALRDPVAVYNAANNMEAQLVRDALTASGVEAFITEDLSPVGTWIGGLIPDLHKPQVWADRADVERATPILDEFERRAAELRDARAKDRAGEEPIEAVCEECGGSSSFPSAQRGSVQKCSHCGAYLDVGGEEFDEDWPEADQDEDEEA